jgi:hypothetical protein
LGHISDIIRPDRAALLAAAFAATLTLGGCGGIEFQGKIFDAVGLSGDHREPDPKMAERPPLLLPPDPKALPQPSNGVAVATARQDWPQNPEVVEEKAVQAKKDVRFTEEAKRQPLNPYIGKPNLFTKNLTKWFCKSKDQEETDDVPEPDPSDKPPEGQNQNQSVAQSSAPKPLTPQAPDSDIPNDDAFHPAAPESYKNPGALY